MVDGEQVESGSPGSTHAPARGGSRSTVLLTAVAMVPEHQRWTLQEPHRSRIARGLAWAAATEPQDTDIDALVKPSTKRAGHGRGSRK